MSVLEIKDLHVEIEGKEILKGVNLTLKTGEIAAIMGPNGTGKSTLSAAIMGNPNRINNSFWIKLLINFTSFFLFINLYPSYIMFSMISMTTRCITS